ncbi:MAG: porin family protein [Bradyrhizobiaceae bacterium]|nr:porin family protein [Bradyrhizobiaceae bacterium]
MNTFLLSSVALALLSAVAGAHAAEAGSPYYNPYPNNPYPTASVDASSPYYNPYPDKAPTYVPVHGWYGFYVGTSVGGGLANTNQTDASGLTTGDFTQDGITIGVTAGYNWQLASVLLGLEGDLSWADIKGSTPVNCAGSCFTKLTWFDTVRGRVGYVMTGEWMPYVTGGLAYGTVRAGIESVDNPITGMAIENANNRIGPTVGVGVEWLFTPSWSAKAEYLYATFGSQTIYTNLAGLPVTVTERNVNLFRAGVNWHFNY